MARVEQETPGSRRAETRSKARVETAMTSEELARMRSRGCHKAGAWQRRPGVGSWAPEYIEQKGIFVGSWKWRLLGWWRELREVGTAREKSDFGFNFQGP